MGAKNISAEKASAVLALHDELYSQRTIEQITGVSRTTVQSIIHGVKSWGKWAQGPVALQYRAEQKRALAEASRTIASQCLEQVEKQLPKASAYQAAGIYGLMRQHERLDMGESTENVALVAKIDATNADQLAARLSRRLVKQGAS